MEVGSRRWLTGERRNKTKGIKQEKVLRRAMKGSKQGVVVGKWPREEGDGEKEKADDGYDINNS